jgi:hypothetical protein
MWAGAYQSEEPGKFCIGGPDFLSMKSSGFAGASVAKKKPGPRAIHAVPSFSSLASRVAVMASRRPGLFDLASAMNWVASDFSAANGDSWSRQEDSAAGLRIHAWV